MTGKDMWERGREEWREKWRKKWREKGWKDRGSERVWQVELSHSHAHNDCTQCAPHPHLPI